MNDAGENLTLTVPPEWADQRADKVLAALLAEHSRAAIQKWLRAGRVTRAGKAIGQRDTLRAGENVELTVPEAEPMEDQPEERALAVVHEDASLFVIDKPAGLVVHPGAGNPQGTLLNALLHYDPELARLPRAGIVHRLDKDTSGLMVVARNESARASLIGQLAARTLTREYLAVVHGVLVAGGEIEAPVGRHARDRKRMTVTQRGRPALTRYRVEERFRTHTLIRASLATGRTHQIRVHMAHRGFPLLGDPVYGARLRIPAGASPELTAMLRDFRRQALHAARLVLVHPHTGKDLAFESPIPADMKLLVAALRFDQTAHGRPHGH
jgi:23S rRNA pseudouridine1911/1915/1917 synthase